MPLILSMTTWKNLQLTDFKLLWPAPQTVEQAFLLFNYFFNTFHAFAVCFELSLLGFVNLIVPPDILPVTD